MTREELIAWALVEEMREALCGFIQHYELCWPDHPGPLRPHDGASCGNADCCICPARAALKRVEKVEK